MSQPYHRRLLDRLRSLASGPRARTCDAASHSTDKNTSDAVRRTARRRSALWLFQLCALAIQLASSRSARAQEMQMAMPISTLPEPAGVSMAREGSGTSWIPEAATLPMGEVNAGQWDLMLHGAVFGEYDDQGGPRGSSQLGSLNWGMGMATHEFAGGRLSFRAMLSLDVLGVTPRGYPLLLQTGEFYDGQPIHDRQHPHNVWGELSAMYEREITHTLGISLYAAPSGDPALGPVAYMHRPSAMDDPFAPIGHHWQDATHVSFGVLTAGLFTHDWKIEGSAFNGREPSEDRWAIDPITLDSYSGRVTYQPSDHWSASASYGDIASPEAATPNVSIHRATASLMHGTSLGADGQWATTLVYGENKTSSVPGPSPSVLLESEAVLDAHNTVFGRVETVQKTADDLDLDTAPWHFAPTRAFQVSELSLGYIREVIRWGRGTIGLGAMGTLNAVPDPLVDVYGSRTPLGGAIFLRLRPAGAGKNAMSEMGSMGGMGAAHGF